jgi:hypothetical protein
VNPAFSRGTSSGGTNPSAGISMGAASTGTGSTAITGVSTGEGVSVWAGSALTAQSPRDVTPVACVAFGAVRDRGGQRCRQSAAMQGQLGAGIT